MRVRPMLAVLTLVSVFLVLFAVSVVGQDEVKETEEKEIKAKTMDKETMESEKEMMKKEGMPEKKMMAKEDMPEKMMQMPFGSEEDIAFAEALWTAVDGYDDWVLQSDVLPSMAPHGDFARLYYDIVSVDGELYSVIIKDNFGGEGATMETVTSDPAAYLIAVTPMVKRQPGYDPDNNDWFWVKYGPDGSVMMNPAGAAMAGRVAKGAKVGCIACHVKAGGGDYLFTND